MRSLAMRFLLALSTSFVAGAWRGARRVPAGSQRDRQGYSRIQGSKGRAYDGGVDGRLEHSAGVVQAGYVKSASDREDESVGHGYAGKNQAASSVQPLGEAPIVAPEGRTAGSASLPPKERGAHRIR
jgi:hypothetical protein